MSSLLESTITRHPAYPEHMLLIIFTKLKVLYDLLQKTPFDIDRVADLVQKHSEGFEKWRCINQEEINLLQRQIEEGVGALENAEFFIIVKGITLNFYDVLHMSEESEAVIIEKSI